MKKLFTLVVLMACFMSAKAVEIVDAFVDFSTVTELPRFSWGGSESAFARLSLQDGCLHFHSTEATDPTWDCQWFPIGMEKAPEVGVVYTLHYKVKGDHNENISALGFGQTPYGQFPITTDWVEGTFDYECTEANGNMLFQAGGYVGDFDIAYLKITHDGVEEKPASWKELLVNGDAEKTWEELGLADVAFDDMDNNYKVCFWTKEKGVNEHNPHVPEIVEVDGGHAFICRATTADTEGDPSAWDNQIWIQSPRAWKTGEEFKLSFRYKASEAVKTNTQVHHQTPSEYLFWQAIGDIDFTTEWQTFEKEVTVPADADGMWSIAFNLNPNVKTPVDFYIDDISWSEMELEHGLFVTAANTENGNVNYDFNSPITFEYDDDVQAMAATVGTKGKQDTWVNEVMISTVAGNGRQFKVNTIKVKGALANSSYSDLVDGDGSWFNYEDGANAKIKLPAQGVWTIFVDVDAKILAVTEVEGDAPRDPIEIVPNETEVVVHGVERDWKPAKEDGTPQDGEEGIGEGQPWDNQFILMANRALKSGEVVVIEFDYVATVDATTNTQCGEFGNPGGYVFWNALGDVNFTTEEQHFSKTYTVPGEADGMGAFNFNMAVLKDACDYTLKNFVWKTEDETESLIDMEGTKNFFVKEGAGTAPYEFGTEKPGTDGISNTVVKNQNNVSYNIAGQRVSNEYKGIVVKNGAKYLNK